VWISMAENDKVTHRIYLFNVPFVKWIICDAKRLRENCEATFRLQSSFVHAIEVITIDYYKCASRACPRKSCNICVQSYRNQLLSFSARDRHAPRFSAACHPLAVSQIH
jgi:hypothetical protein